MGSQKVKLSPKGVGTKKVGFEGNRGRGGGPGNNSTLVNTVFKCLLATNS